MDAPRSVEPGSLDLLWELARPARRQAPAGRPFVTVTFAQTLDGRIATRDGSSRWISCPDSLAFAHCLRASHQAILVGIGTVLSDDPRLTTRLVDGPSPTRVVLDSRLRLPPGAAVLRDGAATGTIVVTTEAAPPERIARVTGSGARILTARATAAGQVDLRDALGRLRDHGIESLLIEGGARTITAALAARVVDRLAVCVAPKVLGAGIEAVGDLGVTRLPDAIQLGQVRVHRLGDDILVVGEVGG